MKNAVVLGGGGSRGAYEIGVWQALREVGYPFEVVTGTSVGAINGALMAMDLFDEAVLLWENIDNTHVYTVGGNFDFTDISKTVTTLSVFLREVFSSGGMNYTPLKELVSTCIDEDILRASPVELGIVTVEAPSFRPVSLFVRDIPPGTIVDYIMASAACFPAMQQHMVGTSRFIDGGYYDNLPIELAYSRGARDIVAIDLDTIGIKRKLKEKDAFVRHIRCYSSLGNFLIFDPSITRRNMRYGYLDGLKAFHAVEGRKFTFKTGEGLLNFNRMMDTILSFIFKLGGDVKGSLERRVTLNCSSALSRRFDMPPSDGIGLLTCCAEALGDAFFLDAQKIYTMKQFNRELLEATDLYKERMSGGDIAALTALLPTSRIIRLKDGDDPLLPLGLDNRKLIFYLLEVLKGAVSKRPGPDLLALAALYPVGLCAAMYLMTMEEHRADIMPAR